MGRTCAHAREVVLLFGPTCAIRPSVRPSVRGGEGLAKKQKTVKQ